MQKPNSIQLKPLWSLIVNEKSVFSSSLRYPNNCKIIHTYAHTPSNKVCLTHLSQFQLGQRSQIEPRVKKQLGKLNFVGNCRRCIRWSLHLKPEHKKKKSLFRLSVSKEWRTFIVARWCFFPSILRRKYSFMKRSWSIQEMWASFYIREDEKASRFVRSTVQKFYRNHTVFLFAAEFFQC